MKVLVACEFSGRVRDAFIMKGHDAFSCDILPGEGLYKEKHLQTDVLTILKEEWDLMIGHPPCTYLCNSGVRWLYTGNGACLNVKRWDKLQEAINFFNKLLAAPIPKIAVENPIMHRFARIKISSRYAQIIQPWQFGHGETKATCLWLKGLPLLKPENVVDGRKPRVHYASPSPSRWKERSITLPGIANAMASQWGSLA